MTSPPDPPEVERFRGLLAQKWGLHFDETKSEMLADTLRQRAGSLRCGYREYLEKLVQPQGGEWKVLAAHLTVGETYFFRHQEQMAAYLEVALPGRKAIAQREGRPLRVLSAGCSTGEEPYSLAMLAFQAGLRPDDIDFLALDLNPAALARARAGRYTRWSLRDTPVSLLDSWFRKVGTEYTVAASVASAVSFREANLLSCPELAPGAGFDIIFCRNVLMYFSPGQAREVARNLLRALLPDGYLFLGHAETMRGLSEEPELINSHNCFYYRLPGAMPRGASWPVPPAPETSPDWIASIEAASERIRRLESTPAASGGKAPSPSPDLARARELVENERYDAALAEMARLSPQERDHPEALLLQAILRLHAGDFERTEDLCRRLLASDSHAGAHYLLALCREGQGDAAAAMREHRTATRLDPGFAMPHLHLGRLARKARDLPTARQELEKALLLLQGEDSPRLRLFGGGFGREALVNLCRSELTTCRGVR